MITTTSRLGLRQFVLDDLDPMAEILGNPEVMHFGSGAKSREETQQWLVRWRELYEERGFGLWAVVLLDSGQVIGTCGLIAQVVDGDDEVEVAYRLHPTHWGRGLATEAAVATKEFAFGQLRLQRVISIIEPANRRSIRVAEKNGMQLEKTTTMWDKAVGIYGVNV